MNTNALETAYPELIRNAEAITDATPLTEQARTLADWTIAHVALSDRILAAAARDLLVGAPVVVDNREAMDPATLNALISRTSHQERIALVRRNADYFTATVQCIPDHAARIPVRLSLVDRDGNSVPDRHLPWDELIHVRATQHLPGHAARLAELARVLD
ncbi:hypothetical protein [Saccharopolyspora sp. NPDC002686]|uniref:hypothetical protein n=1 Tax=Saccharopolyspora sp. NPDC002686 TaxID=3154541 RepID=UPI0033273B43